MVFEYEYLIVFADLGVSESVLKRIKSMVFPFGNTTCLRFWFLKEAISSLALSRLMRISKGKYWLQPVKLHWAVRRGDARTGEYVSIGLTMCAGSSTGTQKRCYLRENSWEIRTTLLGGGRQSIHRELILPPIPVSWLSFYKSRRFSEHTPFLIVNNEPTVTK